MDDVNMTTQSEEMEEFADLPESEYESEETQEVAEPVTESTVSTEVSPKRTEMDSAFAEMRRKNQELERQLAMTTGALGRYFNGEDATELALQARAYAEERPIEDVRADYEYELEHEDLKRQLEEAQSELTNIKVEALMREGLREIQAIDPNVKSLEELGDTFANFIGAGLSTKEAYYATVVMEQREKVMPPDPIGRVSDTKVERDYYTSEELDNLTDEEMDANWDKVMRSMKRL